MDKQRKEEELVYGGPETRGENCKIGKLTLSCERQQSATRT